MKKHIPNIITLLNLISGCLGVIEALKGSLQTAEKYMWIGMLFDFLDGFVARLLKATSHIGKELDSFADMITFGLLPGMMMFYLIKENIDINTKYEFLHFLHNTAFIIPALSAIRLAKFNLDTSQTYHFKGMPTPACALFLASIITLENPKLLKGFNYINHNALILSFISIFCALLLVSNIKFLAFKFNGYKWSKNKMKYIFASLSLILLIFLKKEGILLSLLLYICIAFIQTIIEQKK